MTEADWGSSADPQKMLAFLRDSGRASARKLRLFAVACCRRVAWLLAPDAAQALETAERLAEGRATNAERRQARGRVMQAAWGGSGYGPGPAKSAVSWALGRRPFEAARIAAHDAANAATLLHLKGLSAADGKGVWESALAAEHRVQADLLRDLFRHPSRPPLTIDADVLAWNGGTVVRLAQAAYQERLLPSGFLDPARRAVLADALEDAGCTDAALLEHLRGPGPHVRGCVVVDAALDVAQQ
jgi:hypothetical protein